MKQITLFVCTMMFLASSACFAAVQGDVDSNNALDIAKGGTNGTTAEEARTNLGLGVTDDPAFNSVHAAGGDLAASNVQVVKQWLAGISYTADKTAVVHGGKIWICIASHLADSETEPGVGALTANAWEEVQGTADGTGTDDQTAAEVPFTPFSTIAATTTQAAIEEVFNEATGGTDDQTAAEVSIADTGTLITATDVEGALAENRAAINLNSAKVTFPGFTSLTTDYSFTPGAAALLGATNGTIGDVAVWVDDGSGGAALPIDVSGSAITDTGNYFTTDTINAALQEIGAGGFAGDDLGSAAASDVVALFSGTGDYLKTDGTQGTLPTDSDTIAALSCSEDQIAKWNGTAWACAADATAAGAGYVSTPPTYSDEACTAGQYALSTTTGYVCVASGDWNTFSLTDWNNPEPDPPTVTSFVIGSAGATVDVTLSEACEEGAGGTGTWTLQCTETGPLAMGTPSGLPGSSMSFTLTGGPVLNEAVDTECLVFYTIGGADGIQAVDDGADLAGWTTGVVVDNDSTQTAENYTDILFFWGLENSTTLTANDYSAGDTTAAITGGATFSGVSPSVGSYSGSFPTSDDTFAFDISSNDIIPATGRIGLYFNASDLTGGIQPLYWRNADNSTRITMTVGATGTIDVYWRDAGTSRATCTSAAGQVTTSGHFIEMAWDTNYREVFVDGVSVLNCATTTSQQTDLSTVFFGTNGAVAPSGTVYEDNIMVSNDKARNLYLLRNLTESPR